MQRSDPIIDELAAGLEQSEATGLPPEIEAINQRHLDALNALISNMRAAGIDEDVVRSSVRGVVASYEQELVDALTLIGR
jgi:hypothetical protein